MGGLAPVLAADTREPRLCAALRADAVPSAGHDFVMQPHEDPLLAVGFLAVEPRGQLEARQAIVLGFAGECRRPRRVAVVTVASGEPSLPVIQAQLGMALASLRPPRPNPAPGAGAVSGVRLSAASAQPAAAVESPPVGEGFQVMPDTSFAARCRPGAAYDMHLLSSLWCSRQTLNRIRCFAMGSARTFARGYTEAQIDPAGRPRHLRGRFRNLREIIHDDPTATDNPAARCAKRLSRRSPQSPTRSVRTLAESA